MIKNFEEFIKESYLEGHRPPLYHFTRRLPVILKSDELKMGKPSRGSHGNTNAIAVTRNVDFSDSSGNAYLELDYTKLYNDGYRAYPVDEWAWNKDSTPNKLNKTLNFNKSKFDEIKAGRRGTKHGIESLPNVKSGMLEIEFEERFYTDIKNLGKYIISINYSDKYRDNDKSIIDEYIKKYPGIKVYKYNEKNARKKEDYTNIHKMEKEVTI